jgi:hypothetical protein
MAVAALISLSVTVLLTILSLAFKVAGKLRLSIPLFYFLAAVISTFFTDWTSKNEQLVLLGLYLLIGLVVISWIYSLIKKIREKQQEHFLESDVAWQIRRAREMGIIAQGDTVQFNEHGDLLDPRTGKPIIFGNVEFKDF